MTETSGYTTSEIERARWPAGHGNAAPKLGRPKLLIERYLLITEIEDLCDW